MPGTFGAFYEDKTTNGRKTLKDWLTSRKPHKGSCVCDDCGKYMEWKGVGWCITSNGYLLCSSCMLTWVRENRYHKDTRKEVEALRALTATA